MMLRLGFVHKVTLVVALFVLLSSLIFGIISLTFLWNDLSEAHRIEAESLARFGAEEAKTPFYLLDLEDLDDIIDNMKRNQNVEEVIFVKSDGFALTDGHRKKNQIYGSYIEDEIISKSVETGEVEVEMTWSQLKVAAPIILSEPVGVLLMEYSLEHIRTSMRSLTINFIIAIGVITLISTLMSYVITKRLTSPILTLTEAANEISQGRMDRDIVPSSNDEIGELASTFDKMRLRVRSRTKELEEARSFLEEKVQDRTKQLEEANVELKKEISRRTRMNEKISMEQQKARLYLDLLSHDIGNLHQGMHIGIEMAQNHIEDSVKSREYLAHSSQLLRRSVKLVRNVLLLSKLKDRKSERKPLEILPMIRNSCEEVKDIFSIQDIQIELDFPDKTIFVSSEPILEEVFFNIIHNAVKVQSNGIVRVEVAVKLTGKDDSTVRVEIMDHGIGIRDHLKNQVFERFKQDQELIHTGIGLSLVKELIERYNGKIWVEDRVKGDYMKGSKFIIELLAVAPTSSDKGG